MSELPQLIKESWALVEPDQDKLASYFYARIFLSSPQVRDLFPATLEVQRSRLLRAIVAAVMAVDDPEPLSDHLAALGRDHRKYHVAPEHYDVVGVALIDALRATSGDQWLPEYERAWREGYEVIAERMLAAAAADVRNPAFWTATVIHHERRALDIGMFTVRTSRPLDYRPGQYLGLECDYQPRMWRVYSPANAPRKDDTIDFHVRAVRSGLVSSALVRRLKPGDEVRLAAPMGTMTLDRRSTNDIVCVAGGTGLAPIKALIEELARYNRTRWVHLFFGVRTRDDLYDLADLNRLSARHPWLSLVTAVSDDPGFIGERGDISDVVLRYGPWDQHDFFVSGPPAMMRATLRRLSEMRVPSVRIRHDPYEES